MNCMAENRIMITLSIEHSLQSHYQHAINNRPYITFEGDIDYCLMFISWASTCFLFRE